MKDMKKLAENRSHGGIQGVYAHQSQQTGTEMTFAVFVPPQAETGPRPCLLYLSGLTCTHANVMEKGEYRRAAAEHGLIVVCPDTSPRGDGVADDDAYDLGQGAGFYTDATQEPWSSHFKMRSYISDELPALIAENFPVRQGSPWGIFGHSMGGHGALTMALREPEKYASCSAFSPIVAPSKVPWGQKALTAYLGSDEASWREYDAVALIEDGARFPEFLVDQGDADEFLGEQLKPQLLEAACADADIALTLRMQPGYDHSYFFISSFMADHIGWHAERLG